MISQEIGGVVGSELKVYGVENLRVVDANVMPILPAAHMQGSIYAMAEKVLAFYYRSFDRRLYYFLPQAADMIMKSA